MSEDQIEQGGGHVEKRGQWSSRIAFYFAAIGAAVGFGNVWRFPALSGELNLCDAQMCKVQVQIVLYSS